METGTSEQSVHSAGSGNSGAAPPVDERGTSARIASEIPEHATRAMGAATAKGMGVPGPLRPLAAAGAAKGAQWLFAAARRYPVAAIVVGGFLVAALVYGRKRGVAVRPQF